MEFSDYIQQNKLLSRLYSHLSFCISSDAKELLVQTMSEFTLSGESLTLADMCSFREQLMCEMKPSTYQERSRWEMANILSVWGQAAVELQGVSLPEQEVKKSWIIRFYDYAKRCEDPYIQTLWSQILCKEIQAPNTFFMRTLELLDKAEKFEVDWFFDMAKYVFDQTCIPEFIIHDDTFFAFNKFQTLIDFGLVNPIHASVSYGKNVVIPLSQAQIQLNITTPLVMIVYLLTDAGSQLYELKKEATPDQYLNKMKEMMERNKNVTATIVKQ